MPNHACTTCHYPGSLGRWNTCRQDPACRGPRMTNKMGPTILLPEHQSMDGTFHLGGTRVVASDITIGAQPCNPLAYSTLKPPRPKTSRKGKQSFSSSETVHLAPNEVETLQFYQRLGVLGTSIGRNMSISAQNINLRRRTQNHCGIGDSAFQSAPLIFGR